MGHYGLDVGSPQNFPKQQFVNLSYALHNKGRGPDFNSVPKFTDFQRAGTLRMFVERGNVCSG